LPTAALRFIDCDQGRRGGRLAYRQLILRLQQRPFRIEHGQKIRGAVLIMQPRQAGRLLACLGRFEQEIAPKLLATKVDQGGFGFEKKRREELSLPIYRQTTKCWLNRSC
jgi:hypothetical protein